MGSKNLGYQNGVLCVRPTPWVMLDGQILISMVYFGDVIRVYAGREGETLFKNRKPLILLLVYHPKGISTITLPEKRFGSDLALCPSTKNVFAPMFR